MAKVYERDGGAIAYIFTTGKIPENLVINIPEGKEVKLYPYSGISDEPVSLKGETTIKIEPRKYQRITGLTYDELLNCCQGASPINITIGSKYTELPQIGL